MRVKCLALEHNTVSPARAQTRTAQSVGEHTDDETTAPPLLTVDLLSKLHEACEGNLMPREGLPNIIK